LRQVEALLGKAERSFDAAELLLQSGNRDFGASRAYYGCFYVAEALLLSEGLRFSRHGQVIAQYGQRFVREGRMDHRFHKLLDDAFSIRQIADYAIEFDMDSEELREMIEEGRSFLSAARHYLAPEEGTE
jgi:uncharacterized protein (UPF0332 family)